jgi:hypothetical protein
VARPVRPIQGFNRPRPTTSRAVLSPSDWYVIPYVGSRCPRGLEAVCSGCGPLNPCAGHMATSDSSGSASLGLMRCHGHMAFYVPAHRHVAWCGSHWTNDIVWFYLVHISFTQAPKYTNDISISIVSTRLSQWCTPIWHLRLFMMMPYQCHWFGCSQLYHFMCIWMCSATKDRNTNTCRTCQYKDLF